MKMRIKTRRFVTEYSIATKYDALILINVVKCESHPPLEMLDLNIKEDLNEDPQIVALLPPLDPRDVLFESLKPTRQDAPFNLLRPSKPLRPS